MTTQHTPTPWKIQWGSGEEKDEVYGIYSGGTRIIETDTGFYPPRKADAELIVRAVNSHDDLIHTLENALDHLRYLYGNELIIRQCEQAIARALAEGGTK